MRGSLDKNNGVFKHQPDATLSQDDPVSGQKYTLLDTVINARIIGVAAKVTWSVQPTPLEIHVTVDGQSLSASQANPSSGSNYFLLRNIDGSPLGMTSTWEEGERKAFCLEGHRVKIEVETTGGTVSNLTARAKYAKM